MPMPSMRMSPSGVSPLAGCGKTSVFRGAELQLRHKVRGFNGALDPEEQIFAFFLSLLGMSPTRISLTPISSVKIHKRPRGRIVASIFLLLAVLPLLSVPTLSGQTASNAPPKRASSGSASSEIPHLIKQGAASQLIVDGKPFLALAGELNNDSSSSLEYMKSVWPKLVQARINTVLTPVSWAQIEPQEGKFDFRVLDGMIQGARVHNLHLALLWFASWKNGLSSYPPDWVKKDFQRFPRAQIKSGKTLELLTPLSDANCDADARAFAALMRHVKQIDGQQHTVIMIQVENEIGLREDSRDRSPLANEAFQGPVPKQLMEYLEQHKDSLIPEFRAVWEEAGFKTSGTWEQVFGQNAATDEIFMAWNFARYIGGVAGAGKAEYPIPMFLNAALAGRTLEQERKGERTRFSAVGGPMDDLMDVWRAGAPQIDILGPDAYSNFAEYAARYDRSGNPLFVPETVGGSIGAARVIYAFGRHGAVGFSAMGAVERSPKPDNELIDSYDLIEQLAPLIEKHKGDGTMSGVLLAPSDPPQKIQVGNYTLEAGFLTPRVAPMTQATEIPPFTYAAAIFIAAGPDEYFVAGTGVTLKFSPATPGPPLAGLATVEEGSFVNGRWVPERRFAGDDTEEGDMIVMKWAPGSWVPFYRQRVTKSPIQRVTLYRYR